MAGSFATSSARITLAANRAAIANVTVDAAGVFRLEPPEGANFAGGKLVLIGGLADGAVKGDASLKLILGVRAGLGLSAPPEVTAERTILPGPGPDTGELRVEVALPAGLDSTKSFSLKARTSLEAKASTAASGEAVATSSVDAWRGLAFIRFQVLDAKGTPLVGFNGLIDGKKIPEIAAPAPGLAPAVEFYNAAFGHYFITANAVEIAALDAGGTWTRTGGEFKVNTGRGAGLAGVCRFFKTFTQPSGPDKSSHYYALEGAGCEDLLTSPQGWTIEGVVFFIAPPSAAGECAAGTVPVYRLYNNGKSGAANHRYTVSERTRDEMRADGYTSEGVGDQGVVMCAPQ